jgi:hypothetical protein
MPREAEVGCSVIVSPAATGKPSSFDKDRGRDHHTEAAAGSRSESLARQPQLNKKNAAEARPR